MSKDDPISRDEALQGLLHDHRRINLNTVEAHKAAASLEALLEILFEKRLVDREEFEARRQEADERLRRTFVEQGMSVVIQEHETGKYELKSYPEVDCDRIRPTCRAVCCRLPQALSKEDVEEGVVRWDLGHPYLISRQENGCCVHLDPESLTCGVYAHRPLICRRYDCSRDRRVWADFEKKLLHPKVDDPSWPTCVESETADSGDAA
jgi:Fe-S-cluster containining protein